VAMAEDEAKEYADARIEECKDQGGGGGGGNGNGRGGGNGNGNGRGNDD
jgi:hypothetical protein